MRISLWREPRPRGQLAWEVELLVDAGLPPKDALAAATWRGGEIAGEPTAGKIEADTPADLVLVHGDPLSEPRALWRVWAIFQRGVNTPYFGQAARAFTTRSIHRQLSTGDLSSRSTPRWPGK
jgi:cytosine/adenosine deaminase-related metal-dependent hydrolase